MKTDGFGKMVELTEELIYDLCGYLEDGNYRDTACQLCGFTEAQLDEWLKQADNDKLCGKLRKQVLYAEAEAERSVVYSLVTGAREGDLKGAMDFLKNKYPHKWDRQGKTASIEDNNINVTVKMVKSPYKPNIDEDELRELEELEG